MSVRVLLLAPATPVLPAGEAAGAVVELAWPRTIVTRQRLTKPMPSRRINDFMKLLLSVLTEPKLAPEILTRPNRTTPKHARFNLDYVGTDQVRQSNERASM